MRKPLVVVCGLTVAALVAGGITATTAMADTTPDMPGFPGLELPDFGGFGQWGGGSDDDRSGGIFGPGGGGMGDGGPDRDQPVRDQPDRDQADRDQADRDQADRDQPDRDRPDRHQADRDQADRDHADRTDRKPVAQQRPATAARPGAARPMAAAHREVTPGSVSLSPGAPVQQQVLALVNQNRRRGGCDELTLDRRLIRAAYRHAADMARREYFAHESPNGDRAGDRVKEAGYRWKRYGENIARGQDSTYEVVNGWMHSPVHRENIMDCSLDQMGVGLAFSRSGKPYWVQDFATPREH